MALASFGDHDETALGEQSLILQAAAADVAGEKSGEEDVPAPAQLGEEDEVLQAVAAAAARRL